MRKHVQVQRKKVRGDGAESHASLCAAEPCLAPNPDRPATHTLQRVERGMVLPKDDSMREPRCTDEHHRALKHAERKARTYRKAVLGLAGLLLLSLSGNLASTALTILVFTESRRSADAIPQRPVVLSDSKAAALVGTRASLPPSRTLPTPLRSRCPG